MTTLTSERRINDAEQKSGRRATWVERESDERSDQYQRENTDTQVSVRETSTYPSPAPSLTQIEKPTTPEPLSQVATGKWMEGAAPTVGKKKRNKRTRGLQVADDPQSDTISTQARNRFALLQVDDDA
jgi:predicted secreted Zn-dependent protease